MPLGDVFEIDAPEPEPPWEWWDDDPFADCAPEPPPVRVGVCVDPGCGRPVWDDCGVLVGSCPHWDGEEHP